MAPPPKHAPAAAPASQPARHARTAASPLAASEPAPAPPHRQRARGGRALLAALVVALVAVGVAVALLGTASTGPSHLLPPAVHRAVAAVSRWYHHRRGPPEPPPTHKTLLKVFSSLRWRAQWCPAKAALFAPPDQPVAAAVAAAPPPPAAPAPPHEFAHPPSWEDGQPVGEATWHADQPLNDLVDSLRAAGRPAVVRGFAGRAGWTASTAWAWPALAQADVRLPNVYRKPGPFFRHYTKRKPYAAILDVQPDFDVLNMTAPELVAVLNDTDRGYYYWSGPVAMLGPAVASAVEPHQPLVLEPDKAMYQAWISSKGLVAGLHYDLYHNFFVQLNGRKRFTLFPPSDWRRLALFPQPHPGHRQSQITLGDVDMARFAEILRTSPWRVELAPGDLLYLPPAWFHHVEALDASASVNSWSYSGDGLLADRVFYLPLPLEAEWEEAPFQSVLTTYIRTILETCGEPGQSPEEFVEQLLVSRFHTLPPAHRHRLERPPKVPGPFTCAAPWDDPAVRRALADYRPRPPSPQLMADAGPERAYLGDDGANDLEFPRGLRRRIRARAKAVCALLAPPLDPAVRLITLEDYIQDVVRHFVGIEQLVPYLRTCFAVTEEVLRRRPPPPGVPA